MPRRRSERGRVLTFLMALVMTLWGVNLSGRANAQSGIAAAQGKQEQKEEKAQYQTPLAGEQGQALFMGKTITIPAQDRNSVYSLVLGGTFFTPRDGDNDGLPLAAFYLRRISQDFRARAVVNLFVNDLQYEKKLGSFEIATELESCTIPGGRAETVSNREIDETSLNWGSVIGSAGPGVHLPVFPFQVDNELRVQLLGRVGYFYAARTDDTASNVVAPPSTLIYGAKLRGRYDALRRNLLELPHRGFAAGFDIDYLSRNRWIDSVNDQGRRSIGDYVQYSGYLVAAGGIPGLSERDRLLLSLYGGKTSRGDRFNAFAVNGGPFPSESDDIPRPHYSGIFYDDVRSTDYAIASLAYRRELAFFIYLSLVGTYISAERATVQSGSQVVFRQENDASATISLDSAFFYDSEIYFAYSWDSGFLRGGSPGSGVAIVWSKSF